MKSLFARIKRAAPWLVLAFMIVTILRTALAQPSTAPRESDREAAGRVLESTDGVTDLRIQRPEGQWVGGLGIIEPVGQERSLSAAAPGRIAAVLVEEGTMVAEGDRLIELESGVEKATLAAAEAELASAELELRRVRGRARTADIEVSRQDARAARVRAEQSQSSFARLEATQGSGGLSAEELDRARRQAEQDARTADAAENRLLSAEEQRPLDVRVAQAKRDAAMARRDQAAASLALKQIVAPTAGEVLEVLYEVGEYVQPGGAQPTLVMGDTRTLIARIDIDERDIDAVMENGRAIITVDALPGQQFEGKVVRIARRMGRKNVRSNEPTERIDTKILEVTVELGAVDLIVGQRVMGYLEKRG